MSGFDAELYQLLHTGNAGDAEFYVQMCAGLSVLELGCGAGRILEPLAEAGCDVTGLEAHPQMLESARDLLGDRVTLVQGDMRDFDLGQRFDRVIIPYNGLYCLDDDEGVVRCLSAVARHLKPGGIFIFDGYHIDERPEEADEEPTELEWLVTLEHGGRRIDVYEADQHLPMTHDCRVRYHHRIFEDDAMVDLVDYTLSHHYVMADDLPRLLGQAGLRLERLSGSFRGERITDLSELMVVRAVLAP